MITLKSFAIAYIFNNNKLLMMKRSLQKKFAPGLWAAIGGHIEPAEMNEPKKACIREIKEETGLEETDINSLNLQYIIMRKAASEIRIQYVYFGTTLKTQLCQTEEGELNWIAKNNILNRSMSATTKETLKRYILHNNSKIIEVAIVDCDNEKPVLNWSKIEDWNASSFI